MTELEKYYNKFCEEKRLGRRHGQAEYIITMKYIHKYLEKMDSPAIIDIGAGTGRYSVHENIIVGSVEDLDRGDFSREAEPAVELSND